MGFSGVRRALLRSVPAWVLPGASVDMDFVNGRYYGGSLSNLSSITRAQTVSSYAATNAGLLIAFGANSFRVTNQGCLIEQASTNLALWARDFTNAAWVKVNVTAALTATGADGVVNSASILTATAINGTALQTITLASAQRTVSFYVQRATGVGTVSISQDGLSWTPITINTTGYTKVTLTATQLNPVIGFQIATSGDAVNVDFASLEALAFATSPIPTTTTTQTRNADLITASGVFDTLLNSSQGSSLFQMTASVNTNAGFYLLDNAGSSSNFLAALFSSTTVGILSTAPSLIATLGSGTFMANSTKTGVGWNSAGRSIVGNNGAVAADGNTYVPGTPNYIGSRNGVALSAISAYLTRLTGWNSRLSNATLRSLTI